MTTKRETGTVHFTIGEEMGIRLMEIANEHLIYGNDPIKALKTITDSLIGCPTDYALKILKGDIVLFVDVKDQTIIPTERIPEIHDRLFPKIDVVDYMKKCDKQIEKHSESIIGGWNILKGQIKRNDYKLYVDFDFNDIFKFISGNNEVILERLRDLNEIDQITQLISTTKVFIEHSTKIQKTLEWMYNTWNEFDKFDSQSATNPYVDYIEIKENISDNLIHVMRKMQEIVNLDFKIQIDNEYDNVQKYIDSVKEIDEVIFNGIKPVDIMNNYSAGWLSPTGDYYGLNGKIANMLHNQIADALQDIGLIPIYETPEDERYFLKDEKEKPNLNKINPDSWLEQHGWVKIHGNNINYAGCLNSHINKTNVQMTETQAKIIWQYITECHGGIMRLGWKLQKVTATMFLMAFKDTIAMNKTYFEF